MIDYKQMLGEVRASYATGRTRDITFRKQQLRSLLNMYMENVDLFCSALAEDLRKPRQESILLELNVLRDDILYILNHLDEWAKPEMVSRNLVTMFDRPVIYNEPYGVVLVMGAWNYPVQLCMLPVSGAIAAGNCVIIKPSENAPAVAALIGKLVPQYLDQECYRVVQGGIPETTELLKEKFDYIFYTGSPGVGKIVRRAANEHLTPTTLELGGKSPVYMDDTVDMDVAVRRLMWGKLINAGQTCIAPDYLLCSKAVQDKFVAKAKVVLKEFYGDEPKDSPDFTRIVSERHVDRLSAYLKEGTIAIGGDVDRSQKYISPTVLVDLPQDSKIMNEEIFGPILPIINVESAFEAIQFIGKRDKPLTMYIFTNNTSVRDLIFSNTACGGGCSNDVLVHLSVAELPFGGVGTSGMGSYHGKASFLTFTHRKSCLHRNYNKIADWIGSKRYPPYRPENVTFLSNMLKERWMPSLHYLPHLICFGLGAAAVVAATQISKAMGNDD